MQNQLSFLSNNEVRSTRGTGRVFQGTDVVRDFGSGSCDLVVLERPVLHADWKLGARCIEC
jgi:hypothetical protein